MGLVRFCCLFCVVEISSAVTRLLRVCLGGVHVRPEGTFLCTFRPSMSCAAHDCDVAQLTEMISCANFVLGLHERPYATPCFVGFSQRQVGMMPFASERSG